MHARRPPVALALRTAAILAVLALGTQACSSAAPVAQPSPTAPASINMSGTVVVHWPNNITTSGASCSAQYVKAGDEVYVTADKDGPTLGMGRLTQGRITGWKSPNLPDGCEFGIIIDDVRAGVGFYGINVNGYTALIKESDAQAFRININ